MARSTALVLAVMALLTADALARSLTAATSTSTASASATRSGSAQAIAKCSAQDGFSAKCLADADTQGGGSTKATATGDAAQGNVDVTAIAQALESSNTKVIAEALASGAGNAVAISLAEGIKAGTKGVVQTISKVYAEKGCDFVKPTFTLAYAKARDDGYLKSFLNAFDVDVDVAKCVYPKCTDDRYHCCQNGNDERCSKYSFFKQNPKSWTCESCKDKYCAC